MKPMRDFPDKKFRESLLKADNLRDLIHSTVPDLTDRFDNVSTSWDNLLNAE